MSRVYLAGPMSDRPRFNFPAFERAAAELRACGVDVVSPHELDAEKERREAWTSEDGEMDGTLWADCLARDIRIIAADGIESIVVLPGWAGSRGARLETFVGNALCGLPVFDYETGERVGKLRLLLAWGFGR